MAIARRGPVETFFLMKGEGSVSSSSIFHLGAERPLCGPSVAYEARELMLAALESWGGAVDVLAIVIRFDGLMRSADVVGAIACAAIEALDSLRRVPEEGPSRADEEAGRIGGAATPLLLTEVGVPCCEA